MRIVYESLFGCGPPDRRRLGRTDIALRRRRHCPSAFIGGRAGRRGGDQRAGRAVVAGRSTRPHDVYVHVADQAALNQRIDELLAAG